MRKLLTFDAILLIVCIAAITVYAGMMRPASAPVVFEAEQQHSEFDESGGSRPASWQVVRYLTDGTRVIDWQTRWMRVIGITARTMLKGDGQQDAYLDPLPIPLKTTTSMNFPMMRKAFPAYARTCSPSGEKVLREESLQGYRR